MRLVFQTRTPSKWHPFNTPLTVSSCITGSKGNGDGKTYQLLMDKSFHQIELITFRDREDPQAADGWLFTA